jgi:hypothetical protein
MMDRLSEPMSLQQRNVRKNCPLKLAGEKRLQAAENHLVVNSQQHFGKKPYGNSLILPSAKKKIYHAPIILVDMKAA